MLCDNKKAYLTIQAAQNAIDGRARRGLNYALRVYECPECGCFHLTSQAPRDISPTNPNRGTWRY
jgi:hypothetical protein